MRQLAGHPLRPGLVVPQVRIRCLMLELLDAAAQTLDVEHPLHRGQGAVQGGDVGLTVGVHSSQGYRHQRLASDDRHVHRTTAAQPIRSPLRRSRAQHRRLEYASLLHRHRGLRAVGVLRRGILAEGRRHDRGPRHGRRHAGDVADSWGLVRSGVAPDHPKIKSISKQFEKTAEDPASASSAMWSSANTSSPASSPSATTP